MEESQDSVMTKFKNAVRARRRGLFFGSGLSLAFLILLALVLSVIVPKETYYSQNVQIFLPKNDSGYFQYPNGRGFSHFDVISAEVLHKVYENYQLQDVIDYEDFADLFTFSNVVTRKLFLDEKYGKALQRKNITGPEIKALEQEYLDELARLDQGIYCLSIRKSIVIPEKVAAELPLKVLQTWKDVYQLQDGRELPLNALTSDLEKKLDAEFQNSPLIAVDRASHYRARMLSLCTSLKRILGARLLTLPDTGESLEDMVDRLNYIQGYQLSVLMQMIVEDQALQGSMDVLFVSGRIRTLERRLTELEGAQKSAGEGLAQLEYYGMRPNTTVGSGGKEGSENSGGSQLNFDATFFMQLATLIRNDAMNEPRAKLAKQYNELGIEVAQIRSELEYYGHLREQLKKSGNRNTSTKLFTDLFRSMVRNMIQTSKQLERFKSLIIGNAISEYRFYLPSGPTFMMRSAAISKIMLAVIVFMLWIFSTFCMVSVAGLQAFRPEKKN